MSLTLDPKTTALVLIDLQKGIVSRPVQPHSGSAVVEKSVALARQFAALKAPVMLVHVGFSSTFTDMVRQPVDEQMSLPPGGFPPDFTEFAPEIAALNPDVVILKRQWGAFHGTELDLQLRRRGITTIVLAGIATNIGVESTAREAWQHNYAVVLAEDACSSFSAEMHRFSVEKIMPRISRVRQSAEIMAAFKEG
jgi:nicotinamidase-related amidase